MPQHAPKGLTKKELYSFIEKSKLSRTKQLTNQYAPLLESLVDELIEALKPDIERYQKAHDIVAESDRHYALYMFSGYSSSIDKFRSVAAVSQSIESYFRNVFVNRAKSVISLTWDQEYVNSFEGFAEVVNRWNKLVDKFEESMDEARTLEKELTAIVYAERKADKAYLKLDQLGLDMTGLIESRPGSFLPIVAQPTVSINIFNDALKSDEE